MATTPTPKESKSAAKDEPSSDEVVQGLVSFLAAQQGLPTEQFVKLIVPEKEKNDES